jgi:hypothetical protein
MAQSSPGVQSIASTDKYQYVLNEFPEALAQQADQDDFYFTIDTDSLDSVLQRAYENL